jgi:hypothetical protein
MLLPLYVCRECGKFGGVSLSFSQSFAKRAAGEKIEQGQSVTPECPGHGLMYEVQDEDRLSVMPATEMEPPSPEGQEQLLPEQNDTEHLEH